MNTVFIYVILIQIPFSCVLLLHILSLLFCKRFALKRSKLAENRSTGNSCTKTQFFSCPVKVSDNHRAWESRFPGRLLGDISSLHFFPTVYVADSKLIKSLGILQLSPLCLRSSPPSLKTKTISGWYRLFH